MIVVMPAGHAARATDSVIGQAATDQFVNDFVTDVMPYVEKQYRVITDRANTAIAGLSMGGGQTLLVAIPRLERFAVRRRIQLRPPRGIPDRRTRCGVTRWYRRQCATSRVGMGEAARGEAR